MPAHTHPHTRTPWSRSGLQAISAALLSRHLALVMMADRWAETLLTSWLNLYQNHQQETEDTKPDSTDAKQTHSKVAKQVTSRQQGTGGRQGDTRGDGKQPAKPLTPGKGVGGGSLWSRAPLSEFLSLQSCKAKQTWALLHHSLSDLLGMC